MYIAMKIVSMKTFLSALLWVPCLAAAQETSIKNFVVSPPFDGSRNSLFLFDYVVRCEGYSYLPKDIVVTRTVSGFELAFNVAFQVPNCVAGQEIEARMTVALPLVLPDTALPNPLTLSVRLGDGRRGSVRVEAAHFARVRTVPVPAAAFIWSESRGEQLILASINSPAEVLDIYPSFSRNTRDYCLFSDDECFRIVVCERSGDVGLAESDFGNNTGFCGRGAKKHMVFMDSPSSLSIWNQDEFQLTAVDYADLTGSWRIVDPLAPLKYGLTGIVLERASRVPSSLTEDFLVSGAAGKGRLFCLPSGECRLTLNEPARGNRGMQLNFPRRGITSDRIYRFTPFPDASAHDLALGYYAGLGTWTLVMVRE